MRFEQFCLFPKNEKILILGNRERIDGAVDEARNEGIQIIDAAEWLDKCKSDSNLQSY